MENITLFVELNDEQLQQVTGGKNACDRGGCQSGHDYYRSDNYDYRRDDHYHGGQDQCDFSWGSDCQDRHSWHRHHHSHHCHQSYCCN